MLINELLPRARGVLPLPKLGVIIALALLLFGPVGVAQPLALTTGEPLSITTTEPVPVTATEPLHSWPEVTGPDDPFASAVFSPFDHANYQTLLDAGLRLQEAGRHRQAAELLSKAWQVSRIHSGLYHEAQLPVLESLVASELKVGAWDAVDRHYAYMEHLYKRLYAIEDPRLEAGLRKVCAFHVSAFNANLDGKREYHLRKAANLFKFRLAVAELTLGESHPQVNDLHQSISRSHHQLYLLSGNYRETLNSKRSLRQKQLLADLD